MRSKCAFSAAVLVGMSSVTTWGAAYTFTDTVNSTDVNSAIDSLAINNEGHVVAYWVHPQGITEIDLYANGTMTPEALGSSASSSYTFFGVSNPGINDLDQVSFNGFAYADNFNHIEVAASGSSNSVKTFTSPDAADLNGTSINNSGDVTFSGYNSSTGVEYVEEAEAGTIQTIATTSSGDFSSFNHYSRINSSGQIIFQASHNGVNDVYLFSSGQITNISSPVGPFNLQSFPSINSSGQVGFGGQLANGTYALYISNGSSITPIASSGTAFSTLGTLEINDSDHYVFVGTVASTGDVGIFDGNDPDNDKIIEVGDPLFGSTVTSLQLYASDFNNNGQVAFKYFLANGSDGIAVATPAPEPVALWLPIPILATLLSRRRRAKAAFSE